MQRGSANHNINISNLFYIVVLSIFAKHINVNEFDIIKLVERLFGIIRMAMRKRIDLFNQGQCEGDWVRNKQKLIELANNKIDLRHRLALEAR